MFHEPVRSKLPLTVNSLSAYLFEATNQVQYDNAATLSAEFIKAHLYNGTIIVDSIALVDCTVITSAVTYNSGFFIDGLSVYANYTNNSDWSTLYVITHHFVLRFLIYAMSRSLEDLISTTIKFPQWTGNNGVITEGIVSSSVLYSS